MTPDASVSFYTATMSAHCRSISTVRQIYCVMDGQGKLQIVLSLKDRLCLTFPATMCTLERASRIVPRSQKQTLKLVAVILEFLPYSVHLCAPLLKDICLGIIVAAVEISVFSQTQYDLNYQQFFGFLNSLS